MGAKVTGEGGRGGLGDWRGFELCGYGFEKQSKAFHYCFKEASYFEQKTEYTRGRMILERFVSFVCFLLIRVCLSQRHLKKNLFNSTAISCSQVVEIVTAFFEQKVYHFWCWHVFNCSKGLKINWKKVRSLNYTPMITTIIVITY